MSGDMHIWVCTTRAQKSARRELKRSDAATSDEGEWLDRTQFRVDGRWYDHDFYWARVTRGYESVRSKLSRRRFDEHRRTMSVIWAGSLSRMSADIANDINVGVPDALQRLCKTFGNRVFCKIDDALIEKVEHDFTYSARHAEYKTAAVADVLAFLREHKGQHAFLD